MSVIGELHSIQTADGLIETFGGPDQAFLTYGGYGLPPTEFLTDPAFDNVGQIERDFNPLARPLALELWVAGTANRQRYWDNRARMHNLLRPNRGGPMTLTIYLPDGVKRAIEVRANPGLIFGAVADNNAWLIDEPLELIAHNPIWFDPDAISFSGTGEALDALKFPATFPILFRTHYVQATTGEFTYTGTWETYPTVTLDGPYSSAQLINLVTGSEIRLTTPIGTGEQRIITLIPGGFNVVDENGNSQWGDVDPGSDFARFKILPAPLAPNGVNHVVVQAVEGTVGITQVTLSFNTRYIGI